MLGHQPNFCRMHARSGPDRCPDMFAQALMFACFHVGFDNQMRRLGCVVCAPVADRDGAAGRTPLTDSIASSKSAGKYFTPRMTIRSLIRPVIRKPPARRYPRSPVFHQPSSASAAAVASGNSKYPAVSDGREIEPARECHRRRADPHRQRSEPRWQASRCRSR